MTMQRLWRVLLAAFLVAALLVSCGVPGAGGEQGGVPASLHAMEEAAEDIIDYAPSGNWDKIAADVGAIAKAQTDYLPRAADDGATQANQDALAAAVTELQRTAEIKDPSATMQAANDLSAAVLDLFAVYDPTVPADIGRLDVMERQVILDLAANDFRAATTSLEQTRTLLAKVAPSLAEHKGSDALAQFEASIASQASSLAQGDAAAATTEAKNALELVDVLEKLY